MIQTLTAIFDFSTFLLDFTALILIESFHTIHVQLQREILYLISVICKEKEMFEKVRHENEISSESGLVKF